MKDATINVTLSFSQQDLDLLGLQNVEEIITWVKQVLSEALLDASEAQVEEGEEDIYVPLDPSDFLDLTN